jgi:predicted  nucleic acid-binding Zn-ribbon protein
VFRGRLEPRSRDNANDSVSLDKGYMLAGIEVVSRIQVLDQRCASLEKEIAALPRYVAEIERQLESHTRKLDADKAALAANLKERKTLEGAITDSQQKISKLKDQMLQAKTNEQYRAFQNEITHFESTISKSEDRILELMEAADPLSAAVKKSEGELATEKKHVDDQKVKAKDRAAADQKAITEAKEKRAALVKDLDPAVYKAYEHVRKKVGANAVCEVVDNTCTGCRLALRPQYFQELKLAKDVRYCENCHRIIFYNPPVAPPV